MSEMGTGKTIFTNFRLPALSYNKKLEKKYIDIDSIDLLRATPVTVRKGKSSLPWHCRYFQWNSLQKREPCFNCWQCG